ncbi:MAG: BrnT family toxin [Gammaproteobacteria bacterium]|nr:BrnT family toxin [Gammaproteobacteria bacterium]MCP5421260.1 BrnT family toxin [Gammaproteobacteria bacterium]
MYEWDETKNKENLSKHGLSFEDAEFVFSGPCVTFADARYDYGEERFITLGLLEGRAVVIAHTPRGARTRIISMRKANNREQKIYQKQLGPPGYAARRRY